MNPPKVKSSQTKFSCPYFKVVSDQLEFENGTPWEYNYAQAEDGVCTVALDDIGQVYLIEEFRYPVKSTILSLPAGGVEGFGSNLEAAQAELEEEAGVVAKDWHYLGEFYPSPGFVNYRGHMYLARDLSEGERVIEDFEQIQVMTMPFDTAVEKVYGGEIRDAWAVIPILKVKDYLESL